jgi:hypothetical protein
LIFVYLPVNLRAEKGERNMLFDMTDLEIIRLTGKYRWLPYKDMSLFGFEAPGGNTEKLALLGLIRISGSGRYISLTEAGQSLLAGLGCDADTGGNRAYENSPALKRRLETALVMLTCMRAGADVLPNDVYALAGRPVFLPSFMLRGSGGAGTNLMNAASCVGFGHLGDTAHMFFYVGEESGGMYLTNELSHLHNLSPVFGAGRRAYSMIFAGGSYGEVYSRLQKSLMPKMGNAKGFVDYSEVHKRAEIPIKLLSCDDSGAMQLAVMSRPAYAAVLAGVAFGKRWNPCDAEIPEADGRVGNIPLIIGVDADIRRARRIWEAAERLGRKEVMLAALPAQINSLYIDLLPKSGLVTPLSIETDLLAAAFGKDFSLYTPGALPAKDGKGGFIRV